MKKRKKENGLSRIQKLMLVRKVKYYSDIVIGTGITIDTIKNVSNGRSKEFSPNQLAKINKFFGLPATSEWLHGVGSQNEVIKPNDMLEILDFQAMHEPNKSVFARNIGMTPLAFKHMAHNSLMTGVVSNEVYRKIKTYYHKKPMKYNFKNEEERAEWVTI